MAGQNDGLLLMTGNLTGIDVKLDIWVKKKIGCTNIGLEGWEVGKWCEVKQ